MERDVIRPRFDAVGRVVCLSHLGLRADRLRPKTLSTILE